MRARRLVRLSCFSIAWRSGADPLSSVVQPPPSLPPSLAIVPRVNLVFAHLCGIISALRIASSSVPSSLRPFPFLPLIHPSSLPSLLSPGCAGVEIGMAPSERGTNVKNDYPGFQWTKAHIASRRVAQTGVMHSVSHLLRFTFTTGCLRPRVVTSIMLMVN